jgi:uncharacterized repeat protein (TIGR01451 family)
MRALRRFSRGRGRRFWFMATTLAVVAAFGVVFVAASGAVLPGSPSGFESNDGNMTLDKSGNTDWNCFQGANGFASLASGTPAGCAVTSGATQLTADGAGEVKWVNGNKFDTPCPALTTGNVLGKDDFTNVASFGEVASNQDAFFYGATIRAVANGDSSGNVEFNQAAGDGITTAGCRTAGDLLLAYDFSNGGTILDFHILTWIDNSDPGVSDKLGGNNGTCFVKADSMPCWGANELTPTAEEGFTNQGPIAAADNGISGTTLVAQKFAEFGVNLTQALGLTATCRSFPQLVWESRTSTSFNSNPEDIEIEHQEINTCATPTISTTIKNAADDSVVSGNLDLGSSVYDTASLGGLISGKDPTGTIKYRFFSTIDCSGDSISAGDSVALGDPSSTEGPLAAGSYSFDAQYIAGNDPNYSDSDVSACEPLTINQGSLTPSTTIKNAADDSVVSGNLDLGSSVYDTTQISGAVNGFDPTGTISYTFFQNGDCSGEGSSAGSDVALDGQSNTEGPLGAGSYSFQAQYIAGPNDNYPDSEPSACEPLAVGTVTPSASTTLKNAATDATIANGSTLPHGSSVYDTAGISNAGGFPLTGTVSFRFFHNGACTGDPASVQTGVAVGGKSAASGPLDAGSYGFQAMYVAGNDPNHTDSDWSACEPFTIAPLIDLAIAKSGSPATQTLGDGNITWTIVVTNNGPNTATGVMISDPMPAGNTFVSVSTTQGTCTGGAILSCSLGTIASGGTVTITLVTTPSTVGAQTNTVNVVGNETESNTANNTASATVQTVGVITPPVFCVAVSKVTPKQLFVGRKTGLTIHLTQDQKPVKGVHVLIKGPKLNIRTGASNAKGIVKQTVKMKKAGIVIFTPIASKRCNTKRVGVTNVFTPPVTG